MSVVIGTDGLVKRIQVISGPQLLRKAYVDAVKQWTYRPFMVEGTPVAVQTMITLSLDRGGA